MAGRRVPPVGSRIAEVQRVVADHADDIEKGRRLPDAVVAAYRQAGVNRLAMPVELGGLEAPVRETLAALAAISSVDGSAGWCAAIGAVSNLFAGYLPEASARE